MTLIENQIPDSARLKHMGLEQELEFCKKKCESLSNHLILAMAEIERLKEGEK